MCRAYQIRGGDNIYAVNGDTKKKSTAGRKTTRKKTPSAKKRQKQAYNRELVTEITILITLAVSVLLVISNFDIGGKVGTVISQFFFGLFGWMAYLFPVVLFMGTAFAIANYDNDLMSRKLWGVCTGILVSYYTDSPVYSRLSEGRYGKRILFLLFTAQNRRRDHRCAIAKFLCVSFGTAGAYVLMFIFLIISVIIITQHTVLAPLKKTGEKVYQEALENHARRVEERGVFALEETKLPKGKENNTVPEKENAKENIKKEKQKQREERRLAREAAKANADFSRHAGDSYRTSCTARP